MGRQTRFFMLSKDEDKFFKIIEDLGDLIVDSKSKHISFDQLKEIKSITENKVVSPLLTQLFITSTESKILQDENGFIDQISSDVIEISRCSIIDQNRVKPGRIWAEFRYYDENDQLVKKAKWFEQKFNKYSRWIKKNLRISIDKDSYIGAEAYRLYKEKGYKMMNSPKSDIKF